MEKQVKYNCIKKLKEQGFPIIIVAAVGESEAVANACIENGIVVSAICDNIQGKSQYPFCGFEVIHTPTLPEKFPLVLVTGIFT